MTGLSRVAVVLVVVGALLVAVPTVGAHGNHLSADNQVSGDGSVMIERLFVDQNSYLVLYADNGGQPGEVIGKKAVKRGFHSPITVTMNDTYWESMDGNETVWAVLHEDDGDGAFDPESDGQLQGFGGAAAVPITVRKGAGTVAVAASGFSVKETENNTVVLPQVTTSQSSFVVLKTNTNGNPGDIVGHAALDSGTSNNVSVAVNQTYYDEQQAQFLLWATVYVDDGDGEFDPATDRLVTAGESPVASLFTVAKPLGNDAEDDSGLVNTPTPTQTTVEPAETTTTVASPAETGTATEGPGFGVVLTLVAIFVLGVWRSRQ